MYTLPPANVIKAVLLYSFCSSTLLVANKLTTDHQPNTSFIMVVQLYASVLFVIGGNLVGAIKLKDGFSWTILKWYAVYCVTFVGGIYTNMRAVRETDVETVVVFRCCTPLVVSILDTLLLAQPRPSARGFASLVVILLGASGFVATTATTHLREPSHYLWPAIYCSVISFNMVYGKYAMKSAKLESPVWGAVMYSNGLAVPLVSLLGVFAGDLRPAALAQIPWNSSSIATLALSSALGIAISYAGFNCRSVLSATGFTLVGVMNKLVSVLLSMLIYRNIGSPLSIGCLLLCIVAGSLYK